jgi:glycosyltransferase involved in cell wall biosynthesis
MRVCFFTERQVGINSVARVLKRHVAEQPGVEVTWCDVTYHEPGGWIERVPGLPDRVRGVLRGYAQTGEGLRSGPYDALFFLTHNPAVFRHSALRTTPTCVWTDVTPVQLDRLAQAYDHPITESKLIESGKRAAVARTFRLARRCLGWSDWARKSFVSDYGVEESHTAVVPPGIEVDAWDGAPRPENGAGPFRFVFVGGHFERKGGKVLLEVFRKELRGTCEISIVTRDPVPEEPGVRVFQNLTSGSDEMKRVLREAHAFVLPTSADCHSIASLEAMASGLPVVLGQIGAATEIVAHGDSGFIVPPAEPRPLLEAMRALIDDRARARAMGQRGRALVLDKFDGRKTAARIVEHLRTITLRPDERARSRRSM